MTAAPFELTDTEQSAQTAPDQLWNCVVWDDPVNLMSYVTYVFMTYFHFSKERATHLMLEVHNNGKTSVKSGSREEIERDVSAMHSYGLWATLEKDA